MKYLFKGLFFLIFFFSSIDLSATHVMDSSDQAKLYFNSNALEILDNGFSIHLENSSIETNTIRTDGQGLYVFENDILSAIELGYVKKWKCPYCNRSWPVGQPCQNDDCPSKY